MSEPEVRQFRCDGEDWLAWTSGAGAYGTGARGLGTVEAVHFARIAAPDVPVLEALVVAGGFLGMFDDELIQVYRLARKVVDASEVPARPVSRRARLGDQP